MKTTIKFNDRNLKKAIEQHGENVVKKFSTSTFRDIVKESPQKDTFSATGAYRRTGTLRDGWDIKKLITGGYFIFNEVLYAPYYEYGHRLKNGGVKKGAYLMANAVAKNLKKYGLKARTKGL